MAKQLESDVRSIKSLLLSSDVIGCIPSTALCKQQERGAALIGKAMKSLRKVLAADRSEVIEHIGEILKDIATQRGLILCGSEGLVASAHLHRVMGLDDVPDGAELRARGVLGGRDKPVSCALAAYSVGVTSRSYVVLMG